MYDEERRRLAEASAAAEEEGVKGVEEAEAEGGDE